MSNRPLPVRGIAHVLRRARPRHVGGAPSRRAGTRDRGEAPLPREYRRGWPLRGTTAFHGNEDFGRCVPVHLAPAAAVVLWGLLPLASLAFAAQEGGFVDVVGPMKREQILDQLDSLKWRSFGDVPALG